MDEKKDMLMEQEAVSTASVSMADSASKADDAAENDEDDEILIIKFKKPYKFEGKEYTEIDLSGMEDLTAEDMIAVNRIMKRTSAGVDVMPEVTVEYACHFAARAAKMPVEFFMQLPPKYGMRIKSRVMAFLFGSE